MSTLRTDFPYFRWWVKDAVSDALYASLTDAELGFYHRCLNIAWTNGGLPCDPAARAKVLNRPRAYADKMWASISVKFIPSAHEPATMVNPKQEEERDHATARSEKGSSAVRSRKDRLTSVQRALNVSTSNVLPRAYESDSDSESREKKKEKLEVSPAWLNAQFDSPEHFQEWWSQVVSNHPNRSRNTFAQGEIYELIITGQFKRLEFEEGYAQLFESKRDDWLKDGGKYATNLYEIIHNRLWKFKPVQQKESWITELEMEQNA